MPAVIALFFRFVRKRSWPGALTLAVAGLDLAFVHPTYAFFIAIPLAGYAVVRVLASGDDVRASAGGLASFSLPVLAVFGWLKPIVDETLSHNPSAAAKAAALEQYSTDLSVRSMSSYHLLPGLVGRTGAVAVAALLLTPLAALAARRRWSAFVLGGMVLVLALELSPFLFPRFSNLVSLSQSRRAAGFVPFAFALAGGAAVLTRALRAARASGRARVRASCSSSSIPGDFELQATRTAALPLVTWIALWGGLAGIVAAIVLAFGSRQRAVRATGRRCRASPCALRASRSPCTASRHWDAEHASRCERAHARPRALPADGGAEALRRLRRPRDELSHLRLCAGLCRQRAAGACREHESERP